MPHAIAWRGQNPYQALPEHLAQSYPSLNEHTVGYCPFWGDGIPEHLLTEGGHNAVPPGTEGDRGRTAVRGRA